MTAVAYYATPYEVVTKVTLLSSALIQVLFPAFATSVTRDPSRTVLLFGRGVKFIFLVLFPATLLIVAFAHTGLKIWLGEAFAEQSTRVLQLLTLGVFANSLARIPLALIQSIGRPDLTAGVHLVELPLYLVAVWWMTTRHGIEGTAAVCLVRVCIDALVLFALSSRLLTLYRPVLWRMTLVFGLGMLALGLAMLPMAGVTKGVFLFTILSGFAVAAWFLILSSDERRMVANGIRSGCTIGVRG